MPAAFVPLAPERPSDRTIALVGRAGTKSTVRPARSASPLSYVGRAPNRAATARKAD
jgi:hypothetical protein